MMELDYLVCPLCGAAIEREGGSLFCRGEKKRHCFDLSASGYADLSGRRQGGGGDPKDAVADRTAWLDAGYYAPLADEICKIFNKYLTAPALVIDAGCGEGYYSERIATEVDGACVFGADLSKQAVDRASKRRKARGGDNSFYSVASVFELPVRDGVADGMLSMFSPVSEGEAKRTLRDGGILLVGGAAPEHLLGLKRAVYGTVYLNDIRADLPTNMELLEKRRVRYDISVEGNRDIMRLFGMTPYRFRTSAEAFARLEALEALTTEVDVEFFVYRKN